MNTPRRRSNSKSSPRQLFLASRVLGAKCYINVHELIITRCSEFDCRQLLSDDYVHPKIDWPTSPFSYPRPSHRSKTGLPADHAHCPAEKHHHPMKQIYFLTTTKLVFLVFPHRGRRDEHASVFRQSEETYTALMSWKLHTLLKALAPSSSRDHNEPRHSCAFCSKFKAPSEKLLKRVDIQLLKIFSSGAQH